MKPMYYISPLIFHCTTSKILSPLMMILSPTFFHAQHTKIDHKLKLYEFPSVIEFTSSAPYNESTTKSPNYKPPKQYSSSEKTIHLPLTNINDPFDGPMSVIEAYHKYHSIN